MTSYGDRPYTRSAPKEKKPAPKQASARSGKAEPWSYGPFRVVAQRRVSEEEQLSVECYATTVTDARGYLREFLADFRAHMQAYNEQVVAVQQQQLQKIEAMIEDRGAEARRIESEIHILTAQKHALAHPDAEEAADADEPH